MEHSKRLSAVLAAAAISLFATNAPAVDGVILIDQNKALAGNATPGDTAGFPVIISQPGSYRLSSNLTVPSGQSGIQVNVSNVTIDLNGFGITTPVQPVFPTTFGIFYGGADAPTNITILNGSVQGFVVPVSFFAQNAGCQFCTFEKLLLRWGLAGASASLDFGSYIRIHRVTAPGHDINVRCPSVVTNTVARSINIGFAIPGEPIQNAGICTFAHNGTL